MSDLRTELLESYRVGNLLETAYRVSLRDPNSDESVPLELAAMHNEKLIDIVAAFDALKNDRTSHADFFLTRHLFEKALPEISAPTSSVMRCVLHLYQEAGQDLAAGTIIDGYIAFCQRSKGRAYEALAEIEKTPDDLVDLLPATITAGERIDRSQFAGAAIRLCNDANLEVKRRAVFCLGRFGGTDAVSQSALAALEKAISSNTDDRLLAAGIRAAFSFFDHDKSTEKRVTDLIRNALDRGGEQSIHAASEVFGFHTKALTEPLLDELSTYLAGVAPENTATLRNIGFGLSALLETSHSDKANSLLERLLIANPEKLGIKAFSTVEYKILRDKPLLRKTLTRWFSLGTRPLCKAIEDMVNAPAGNDIELEIDPNEIQPGDPVQVVFVARKTLGYLFFKPVTATSVLLSLMRHASTEEIRVELAGLIFDPLLTNFTGAVRDFLTRKLPQESPEVKQALEVALNSIDQYLVDLNAVGTIPALHPPAPHQEAFRRHFSRQFEESFKKARANSPFLNLVRTSVILHGSGSIHYVQTPSGESKRMDMSLKKIGTQIEVPRLQQIDPFGLEYMLRVFRAERLKK